MNPFTVKAWKTTIPQGDGEPFCAVSILVYEEGFPKGPPWVMSERQAKHIFGIEAIDSLPLVPEMKDAVVGEGLEVDQVWSLLNLTKTNLERGLKKLKRKDLLDAILAGAPSRAVEKVGFSKVKEA